MNDREIFSTNLKRLLQERNILRSDFAKRTNINYNTVVAWTNGTSYPRVDALRKIADFFHIAVSELTSVNGVGLQPVKTYTYKLLSTIACGEPQEENLIDIDLATDFHIKSDYVLKCDGDSMSPLCETGDYIFIKICDTYYNGDVVAVEIDRKYTLKRFYKKEHSIMLMPENKLHEPIIINDTDNKEVKIVGKAVYYLKPVK